MGYLIHDLESGILAEKEEAWDDFDEENTLLSPHHILEERQPETSRRSTAYLDGLRGLAAFLVYMSHQVPWWYGMNGGELKLEHGFGYDGEYYFATLPFLRTLFTGGSAAVAIFFVLSGYVLSVGPLRQLRDSKVVETYRHLLSAAVRRPLRLFIPPIGISFAFAMTMHLPFGLNPHLAWPEPEETIFEEIKIWLGEIMFMINPFEKHGIHTRWFRYDPPVWTMAVELQGSVLVFGSIALFTFAPSKYRMYLTCLTGLFFFAIYQWAMALFMAGMALAINDMEGLDSTFLSKRLSSQGKTIFCNTIFVVGWWLLSQPAGHREPELSYGTPGWYFLTNLVPENYWHDEYYRFWIAIGAVMLVYAVLRLNWLQEFFSRRSLQYLGRISFSLYLLHVPIMWTIGDRICRTFGVIRQEFETPFDNKFPIPDIGPQGFSLGFLAAHALILPLNLILAECGTRLLDGPSVTAGKWVVDKLGIKSGNSQNHR